MINMIRTSCLILFLSATSVLAQPLYKWVEPDGAITFSPVKPANGVQYEVVDQAKKDATLTGSESSHADNSKEDTTPRIRAVEPATVSTQTPAKLEMTPAPAASSEPKKNAVSAVTAMSDGQSNIQGPNNTALRSVSESAAMRKQRQCQDLKKRVISLERRLKSRLTPEDMDNTVIHMARYQRSFDQHCSQ